jgi:hypothetical protein
MDHVNSGQLRSRHLQLWYRLAFHRLRWLPGLALVCVGYLAVSTYLITQPAIYLDEINPDYLAVKIIHPNSHTAAWVMPGNDLIRGRFPLFLAGTPYNASWHAYLQVPFLYLLGGTVESFRMSHVLLGILLLSALFALVANVSGSIALATLTSTVLALDPAFIFAFRTQGFQMLFPAFFILLGILLCYPSGARLGRFFLAGIFFGLSAWGYFIYFFALPGVLLAVYLRKEAHKWRRAMVLLLGIFIGVIPYFIAYVKFIDYFGNVGATVYWLKSVLQGMNRAQHPVGATSIFSSLAAGSFGVVQKCWTFITGEWVWEVIFGLWHKDPGQYAKAAVLIVLPLIAYSFKRFRRDAEPNQQNGLLLGALATLSYLVMCIPLGGLLLVHHYHPVLPLLYFTAAISGSLLLAGATHKSLLSLIFSLALMGCNLNMTLATFKELRDVGGAKFYSHVVTDYPLEEAKGKDVTPHVFVDWGGMLQFIYLTEGRIPTYDVRQLTSGDQIPLPKALCKLGDAKLIFIGDGAATRAKTYLQSQQIPVQSERTITDEGGSFSYVIVQTSPRWEQCQ